MSELDLNGKRMLFIKPSSLGDVCHGVASAWALKARWPKLHLTWLINANLEPLLKGISCIDATAPFDRSRFKGLFGAVRERKALKAFFGGLRERKFDIALDMQGLLRSGLFALLSGAKTRVGFSRAREGARLFYTRRVDTPPQPVHARDRYDCLTAALGCEKPRRQDLDVNEADRERARALVAAKGAPLIAICPGARWESKRYPPQKFAAMLDGIAASEKDAAFAIVGSEDMREACDAVEKGCRRARILNLCGKTGLRELAALLDVSELLITCDSGPMHIAAAQGKPVVAILGPTDPRRTGPYGQLHNVITGRCELMPCLKRQCPGLGDKCMNDLEPRVIIDRALAVIRANR